MNDTAPYFSSGNMNMFSANASSGFSLGDLNLSKTSFSLGNFFDGQSNDNKRKNEYQNRQANGKTNDRERNKSNDVSVVDNNEDFTDPNPLEDGDSHERDPNSLLSKASKKIQKQTIAKLRKNAEKHGGKENDKKYKDKKPFNKGKSLDSKVFFKTKICPHFIEGLCKRGDSCNYAHSQSEIKDTPNLKKTRLCQLFQVGRCNMGNMCSFAHGEHELRSTPDFFKRSMCNAYLKGDCKMGESCRFAHGEAELRNSGAPAQFSISFAPDKENSNPMIAHSFNPIKFTDPTMNTSLSSLDLFKSQPTQPTYNSYTNDVIQSNFTVSSTNKSAITTSNSNPAANNLTTSFSGFNFAQTSTNPQNTKSGKATASVFNPSFISTTIEKKTPTQTSTALPEGLTFNTFNPEKLASLFNPTSSFNIFN